MAVLERLTVAVVAGTCLAAVTAGCRRDTVRVSYRPPLGAHSRHEVRVHSETTVQLAGSPEDHSVDDVVLVTDETVLDADPDGVHVEVRLHQEGAPDRTFVVRLDRAAQLAGVEAVEGLPPSVLGSDALPQLLPGAAGAPPDRPLAPGERWSIDAPAPPGAGSGRLTGSGRLVELGLLDGHKVASTRSSTRLPLSTTTPLRGSVAALDGVESTEGTATRALSDGTVERAKTVTRGRFELTLAPAGTAAAPPLHGFLSLEVRSQTRRL